MVSLPRTGALSSSLHEKAHVALYVDCDFATLDFTYGAFQDADDFSEFLL